MTAAVKILILAYPAHETIVRAMANLHAQTLPDCRAVIAGDDGSDYLATLAAAGIDNRRTVQVSTGSIGNSYGPARNAALAMAKAPFVALLDSDDAFQPTYLAELLPLADRSGKRCRRVR